MLEIDTKKYIDVFLEKFGIEDILIDSSDAQRILEEMKTINKLAITDITIIQPI